jgi:hypothetical protein
MNQASIASDAGAAASRLPLEGRWRRDLPPIIGSPLEVAQGENLALRRCG